MPPLTPQTPAFIEPSSPELSAALDGMSIGRRSPKKVGSPHELSFHPYARPRSQSHAQPYAQMSQVYARTSQGLAERTHGSPQSSPPNPGIYPYPQPQGFSQRSSGSRSEHHSQPTLAVSRAPDSTTAPEYEIVPQRSLVSRSALAFMNMKAIPFVGLPHKTPGVNLHALRELDNVASCVQHAHGGVIVSDMINGRPSFVVRLEVCCQWLARRCRTLTIPTVAWSHYVGGTSDGFHLHQRGSRAPRRDHLVQVVEIGPQG